MLIILFAGGRYLDIFPLRGIISDNWDELNNLDKILDYIYDNIDTSNILIYCYDEKTISSLIISLFLIYKGGVSKDNVRSILKSKNGNISVDIDLS